MNEIKGPSRDRRTGRYQHVWGVIGEPDGEGIRQVDECQIGECTKVKIQGIARLFPNRDAVRNRADVHLLEGY